MSASAGSRGQAPARRASRRWSPRWAKLSGCALIVAVAGGALGLTVPMEVKATARLLAVASVRVATRATAQESCLYELIRQELPQDSRFYVDSTSAEHVQRLAELATSWALPEPDRGQAQFEIDIIPGGCDKVGLRVRRLPVRHP
jgi:hypothetical protein